MSRAAQATRHDAMVRVSAREPLLVNPVDIVKSILEYRELLVQLVKKELKTKYKDSVLGFLWTLVRPLMQLIIYWFAFTVFLGSSIPMFPIFLYSGLVAWNLFTDIVGGATGCIVGNGGLIKKVWFPREILVLAVVGAALVNFAFQMVVLVVALVVAAVFGMNLGYSADLLLFPPALLVLVLFSTAFGLFLAAWTVYLRDIQHLMEVVLLFWFWLTPIVYSVSYATDALGERSQLLADLYLSNPMTTVVTSFQKAFYNADPSQVFAGDLWPRLVVWTILSLLLLYAGQREFSRLQGSFAQEL